MASGRNSKIESTMDISKCYKKCIELIKEINLIEVINILKNSNIKDKCLENDKYLFNVLLHLSLCADKCDNANICKSKEIFKICNVLCKSLTKVTDKDRFLSALYYISTYLVRHECYEEAKTVCNYLMPGDILSPDDLFNDSAYNQLASMWYKEILKKLNKIAENNKLQKENTIKDMNPFMKFHMQILSFCSVSNNHIFKVANVYVQVLVQFSLQDAFPYYLTLFKSLSNYIAKIDSISQIEAYNFIIITLAYAFYKRKDVVNNKNALNYFRQCDSYLLNILKENSQIWNCYILFREFTINLLETNFMANEIGEIRFKKCIEQFNTILQEYGNENSSVTETVAAVSFSFDIVFPHWQNMVNDKLINTKLKYSDIFKMSAFVKPIYSILKNRKLPSNSYCKMCPVSSKCKIKTDICNSAKIISKYILLLEKFNIDFIDHSVFSIIKMLLQDLINVYEEVNKANCKYSTTVWEMCGRAIYNMGILCDLKYSTDLEKLYELLLKYTVSRDGLSNSFSFGLQDPVSSILHRLYNIYFSQEKYEEAMVYVAVSTLLNNSPSRKKKAFLYWGNCKLKQLNSKNAHTITILNCLRINDEKLKKLGIEINLENYDLSKVCLNELKSLYTLPGDYISSIKNTLQELESVSDNLDYARGILYLCFHALQLNKRENIFNYISDAINKLQKYKPKTKETLLLLANLQFFKVVEKLYTRRQKIAKYVDHASFTIRDFIGLRNNQFTCDTITDEDDIAPTYAGVSISQDKKCAEELQSVVTMWNRCIEEDIESIVKSWEPNNTLDSIIICGAYCRLYKFNMIEQSVWKLAYKLASATQNDTACLYVVSRCISLRCINNTWISDAQKHMKNVQSTTNADSEVEALFLLSLADFYFDCKKVEEAIELLEKVKVMPNHEFRNLHIYVYSLDIQFRNFSLINTSQETYCRLIGEIHYSLTNIYDIVTQEKQRFTKFSYHLYLLSLYFEVLSNVAIPMNSFQPLRDICCHLTFGLKLAQCYGLTLTIAQLLKYYCYIDLQCLRLENCETRLQDMEHILNLENFEKNVKDENEKVPTKPGSPELKTMSFRNPVFLSHQSCQCFFCSNLDYQYLTFACVLLRAKIYAIQELEHAADQHFSGAWDIKMHLDKTDGDDIRRYNMYKWKRRQIHLVDIVLYFIDYHLFVCDTILAQSATSPFLDMAQDIINKNDLSEHCICDYLYTTAAEFMFSKFAHTLDITVPDDIPITITNKQFEILHTPKQQIEKPTRKECRRKSPQPLAIPKLIVNSDDNSDNNYTKTSTNKTSYNVRRKLLVEDIDDSPNDKASVPPRRSSRLSKK